MTSEIIFTKLWEESNKESFQSSGKDGVQYWPDFDDHEGATQVYGNYTVTMTDKRSIYSYMDHRVFQVTFVSYLFSSLLMNCFVFKNFF